MHNVDEFQIVQGDTLDNPSLIDDDKLRQFDVIMANPPYSVKRWNQTKWTNDPFGRNIWGTPPQGCADYAFQQHIISSLKPDTGRCVILWPHGVLFRDAERNLRCKMIEADLVDAIIGLGKNLFYNSSMESCLLVCRKRKPRERKGKIIFINAVNEVKIERSMAWLEPQHIEKIADAYREFADVEGFAKVMTKKDVLSNEGNLSIQLYVQQKREDTGASIENLIKEIETNKSVMDNSLDDLFLKLRKINIVK
jgi:type I restriction enzyme M protein